LYRFRLWLTLIITVLSGWGCTTGQGEGQVSSKQLSVADCWNGPFELSPTFFGANPYTRNDLSIRLQRGDDLTEVSDGLTMTVREAGRIRETSLGTEVAISLPAGVAPPGTIPRVADPDALVSMVLSLHGSCHAQNSAIYAVDGTIRFNSLFSGNLNESNADARLTDADFNARFADPRLAQPDGTFADEDVSEVTGWFRFFFQRGPPAQAFP
jgi:hypothetical protein